MTHASLNLYRSNAFRCLGISLSMTDREIRRRVSEYILQAELGLSGAGDPNVEAVRSADAALIDPTKRLSHELFWLQLTPEVLEANFDPTDAAQVERALGLLEPLADEGSDVAMHDLAVVLHASVVESQASTSEAWALALRY
jgi:hypothetical protein